MWKSKLSYFCVFFSLLAGAAQVDFQFYDESTEANQAGILTSFSFPAHPNITLFTGIRALRTPQEWTRFDYKLDTQWNFASWACLHLRAAHRLKLPGDFSDTTLMPQLELKASFSRFKFFISAGLYYRFVSVVQGSLFPFYQPTDFSDWDLVTQFGIATKISSQLTWLNRVSTFDEVETFNLNHPFIETSLRWQQSTKSFTWGVHSRYHMLLGFGRLDRLMLGLLIAKDF